jgi:dipeptidyl aminopeptidase/acylaminoacyl peptidase
LSHTRSLASAAFSPDGRVVAAALSFGDTHLWDVETGKEIAELSGYWTGAFSPDGRKVVTATFWDGTARVWDVETGNEIVVLDGHTRLVQSAAFSPDGHRVVTASEDSAVALWDVETGKVIAVLIGHKDGVNSAAFSPDGRSVVSASLDMTARIWPVFPTTQSLVDNAKAHLPRCLTQEQRARFFLVLEPPRWCITGTRHEAESDSSTWEPLWPYQPPEWRDWLLAADEARKQGTPQPPAPKCTSDKPLICAASRLR